MHDDTANSTPTSGNMSTLLYTTSPTCTQTFTHSTRREFEEPKTLRRILVVEDDASLAKLEADVLTACGYNVAIACTGELATVALRRSMPDLVVLDLELPGILSGWDVLQVVRMYSRIPVLLTSSESAVRKRIRTRGETRSTLDHLPKPYPMPLFLKRIKRMLVTTPQ